MHIKITIKDLEQYQHLRKEVNQLAVKLESFNKSPGGIVSDSVRGSSHSAPYQERIVTITGLDHRQASKYYRLKALLEERADNLTDLLLQIETFISTVTRSDIRRIIAYRYMDGISWRAVSKRIYGYPSETRARNALTRFFAEI